MCFRKVVVAGVVLAIGAVGSASASDRRPLVEGGIGDKPFVEGQVGKTRLGGYTEAHFRYGRSDGITEEITGLDLVELQIRIARGESIANLKVREHGVAHFHRQRPNVSNHHGAVFVRGVGPEHAVGDDHSETSVHSRDGVAGKCVRVSDIDCAPKLGRVSVEMNVLKVEHCAVTTLVGEGAASEPVRLVADAEPSQNDPGVRGG